MHTSGSDQNLHSVSLAFEQWRSSGVSKWRTPDQLQQQCAELIAHHSRSEICRTLRIPYSTLTRWTRRFAPTQAAEADHRAPSTPSRTEFVPLTPMMPEHSLSHEPEQTSDALRTVVNITLPSGAALCTELSIPQLQQLIHIPDNSVCADQKAQA